MTSLWALMIGLLLGSPQTPGDQAAPDGPSAPQDPYWDNACVQCHRSIAGRSAEIVDLEWAESVHAENGVVCEGCHGGDANLSGEQFPTEDAYKEAAHLARNPEFFLLHGDERAFVSRSRGRSISYFCGRCHTEIMEKHLGSPHGNFGDPSCLFCHGQGGHLIRHAGIDIIDTRPRTDAGRCSPCHQASTMKALTEIKEVLKTAAEMIDSSAEKFLGLEEMGYRNLALEEMHHRTAETHSRLRRVFHSFNMRDINDLARSIEGVAKQTDYAFELVQSLRSARRSQTLVGLGAVLFLLLFAALLLFYKHAYCEHYDRSTAIPDRKPGARTPPDAVRSHPGGAPPGSPPTP